MNSLIKPETPHYIHLFISPSPFFMNWSSPRSLLISMLKNSISGAIGRRRITLGHVNMELVSDNVSYPIGMHYRSKLEALRMLFRYKSGFGLLFHSMLGRFNNNNDIQAAKIDFKHGKTSVITFILNKSEAEKIIQYRKRFLDTGEQYNYGSLNNPYLGPSKHKKTLNPFPLNDSVLGGAGCTALVTSFLDEIMDIEEKTLNNWMLNILVPNELIGPYNTQIYNSLTSNERIFKPNMNKSSKVPLWKLIYKKHKWAQVYEPHKFLNLISPNLIYKWFINKLKEREEFFPGWETKKIISNKKSKNTSYQVVLEKIVSV